MTDRQDDGHLRRQLLGAGSVALAAASADPGPENRGLTGINPDALTPPVTDHGGVQSFWQSFSLSHRRIQDGGWARQVNQDGFPIAKDLACVKLNAGGGGVRGLHWHAVDEVDAHRQLPPYRDRP